MSSLARWEKLLERIQRNPKHVTFEDMDTLLIRAGFERRQPRSGSSHYIYSKGPKRITIPRHRPLKPIYVKLALEVLEGDNDDD